MSLELSHEASQRANSVDASDVLDAFAPHLHRGLAQAESAAAIHAVARNFWPFSSMVLELHLGQPQSRVDFSVHITRAELRRAMAQGWGRSNASDGSLLSSPGWKPIRDFFDAWANPSAGSFYLIENIWLAVDVSAREPTPMPAIYFDMDRAGIMTFAQRMSSVQTVLKSLYSELPAASCEHLTSCVEGALPELRMQYVGLLMSRNSDAVRVSMLGKCGPAVVPYLQRIGRREDAERLEMLLSRYSKDADKLILDIDLSTRTRDPVGLKLFWSPQRSWEELFALLEDEGLCGAEEARHILAWPGRSFVGNGAKQRELASAAGLEIQHLTRRLSHVKLTFDSATQSGAAPKLRAKAYLHLCYG